MSKLRDIINAATPGPWYRAQQIEPSFGKQFIGRVVHGEEGLDNEEIMEFSRVSIADADFIATFDPEHVALMEAERSAAREFITQSRTADAWKEWDSSRKRLNNYRKERGLDG